MARRRNLNSAICDACGAKFSKRKEEINRTKHSFCSPNCHGAWMTRQANEQSRNGIKVGDDVIMRITRRGRAVLGLVNGFCRDPDYFRVVMDGRRYDTKQKMSHWLLLRDVDPDAACELHQT